MIHFTRPAAGIEVMLLAAVLVAAITDMRWRRIPNWLTAGTVVLGFLLNALVTYPAPMEGVWLSLKGFALAFALNLGMYALRMTGAGDVKLMAAIGALVGCSDFVGIFLLNAAIGGVLAILLVAAKGRVRQTLWNVGYMVGELMRWRAPYLSREQLNVNSPKALTLPRAVPIFLGVLAFLALARVWVPV
ncbi:MAG: A24 family peptidase [Bryobacteraceae bacterium]